MAKKAKQAVDTFRKAHKGLEFLPIAKDFQLSKVPRIIVHFKSLPSLNVLNDLKTAVGVQSLK